jgi:hypothetical protein
VDNREKKLIAFDMDGTVLAARGEVTSRLRAALEYAMEKGVYVVPCTGRSRRQLPMSLEALSLPYTITANGARVRDEKKGVTIHSDLLDWQTARGLCKLVKRFPGASVCVYIEETVYFEGAGEAQIRQSYHIPSYMEVKLTGDAEILVETRRQGVEKLFVRVEDASAREAMRCEVAKWPQVSCSSSSPRNLEFGKAGCSKGAALCWLCQTLNVEREAVLAFGDGENDREMLRFAGRGLAVGNALPVCKKAADQVIGACEEDGVARYLEEVFGRMF